MSTLYDIIAQSNQIERMLDEANGEITPELEALMTSLDLTEKSKVDAYDVVLNRLAFNADFWKSEGEKRIKMSRSLNKLYDRIRDRIKETMIALDKKEISGDQVRYVLSKTTPKLEIDEAMLDQSYKMQVVTYVPDKEKIKMAIKEGHDVDGAYLKATWSLRTYLNKE